MLLPYHPEEKKNMVMDFYDSVLFYMCYKNLVSILLVSDRPNSGIVRNQPNRSFWTFFARNYRTEPNRTLRLIVLHDFKQDSHLWSLWLIQCASWCSFHHECNCAMYILIQWVPWNWLLCKITTFVAKMGEKLCYRTC